MRFNHPLSSVKFGSMTHTPFVDTYARVQVDCDCSAAFALMSDMERFPSFFTGFGPIPHVVRCELLTAMPVGVGTRRLITNGDGSALEEIVQVHETGKEQMYRIEKGFVPPFSLMIAAAEGHWRFEPKGERAQITWHYKFELKSVLFKPIAWFIVHVLFKRAMQRCLENMKAAVA